MLFLIRLHGLACQQTFVPDGQRAGTDGTGGQQLRVVIAQRYGAFVGNQRLG